MLISDQFFSDKFVNDAIDIILQRMGHYQSQISQVLNPKNECSESFAKLINIVDTFRGPLYFPYLSSGIGSGPYVECSDGSVKLDFISGIGVHWSHGDRDIVKSSIFAAVHDTVMQGNLQQHRGSVDLFKLLCESSGLDYAFLTSSGVMAVENALKICFQKRFPAKRILAFSKNFCGRTLAAASITDKAANRLGIPKCLDVDYIPFYDRSISISENIDRCITLLSEYIKRYPDDYACMKFELIQGEGGIVVGSRLFFKEIIKFLKQNSIPVVVDETQTFGRTTHLFAFQMFDLQDDVDVVCIGKLSQVCATLYKKSFKPKPGLISQTFTSSTSAIEASKVIIDQLLNHNYLGKNGKISKIHGYFSRKFRQLQSKYPDYLSDLRGVGTMVAFRVFDGEKEVVLDFISKCFDKGLISFIAGNNPSFVRFLLPVGGLETSHIDVAFLILEDVLTDFIKQRQL
jgi:acetylornithine/N-succinyldiaminopimelate aminotransferase